VRAFADGDYARVRVEAPKLAETTSDAAVRDAARILRERIEPDRLALALMGLAGAILVALSAYWITHAHTPPTPPNAPSPSTLAPPPVTIERIR
jgi:hypothetical protein